MSDNTPIKIKQRISLNVGTVVFLFVFVYLLANIYILLTRNNIAIYEVREGSLYSPSVYKAICLRNEETFYSENAGYINFYFKEGDRVKKNETVYSIGADRSIYDNILLNESKVKLSNDDIKDLKAFVSRAYAHAEGYEDYKTLGDSLKLQYKKMIDGAVIANLSEIVSQTGITPDLKVVSTSISGIVSYCFDAYSRTIPEEVSRETFTDTYESKNTYTSELINEHSPVYKIIKSDEWQLLSRVDETFYEKLQDSGKISFKIEDDIKVNAPYTKYKKDGEYYILIKMDKYTSEYSEKRFVDLRFNTEESKGLKIPVSSLAYKKFYRIPESYIYTFEDENNHTHIGLTIARYTEEGEPTYGFFEAEIFWQDNGFYYINSDHLSSEEIITTPRFDNNAMLYSFECLLEGAYNLNNGYAVFKRVETLDKEKDYVLIKKNSKSGLNAFDHIALNGENVSDGTIVY